MPSLLLINENKIVSRLFQLSCEKNNFSLKEIQEINFEDLKDQKYNIVFVDSDKYSDTIVSDIKSSLSFDKLCYIGPKKSQIPEGFDLLIEKPFLPTDFVSIVEENTKEDKKQDDKDLELIPEDEDVILDLEDNLENLNDTNIDDDSKDENIKKDDVSTETLLAGAAVASVATTNSAEELADIVGEIDNMEDDENLKESDEVKEELKDNETNAVEEIIEVENEVTIEQDESIQIKQQEDKLDEENLDAKEVAIEEVIQEEVLVAEKEIEDEDMQIKEDTIQVEDEHIDQKQDEELIVADQEIKDESLESEATVDESVEEEILEKEEVITKELSENEATQNIDEELTLDDDTLEEEKESTITQEAIAVAEAGIVTDDKELTLASDKESNTQEKEDSLVKESVAIGVAAASIGAFVGRIGDKEEDEILALDEQEVAKAVGEENLNLETEDIKDTIIDEGDSSLIDTNTQEQVKEDIENEVSEVSIDTQEQIKEAMIQAIDSETLKKALLGMKVNISITFENS